MELVKTKPACKDYIWGGTKLKSWGKEAPSDAIAECWELSFNDSGPTLIDGGEYNNKPLKDVATKEDIGSISASFPFFPVLIKFIDSASNLSVQVHPSDAYALEHEHQYGKTEMWHILEAEKGAGLYIGFKRDVSKEEVSKALYDGSILSLLNFVEVKPGENYFIPSGTVHAIGGGVTLIEIQQNSTLTYRLYDYNRLGKDGKPRELHIEKALKVLNYSKYNPPKFKAPLIGECPYFSSYCYPVEKTVLKAPSTSFFSLSFFYGKGKVGPYEYKHGDTFFLPSGKEAEIEGEGTLILTEVKGK